MSKISTYFQSKTSKILLTSLFGISIILTLILLISASVFIFFRVKNVNSVNNIILPEGKVLHDLNKYTVRDHEIYRYHSDYIVLDEDEEFEPIVSFSESVNEDIIITATPHTDDEFSVECEGTCNCYVEEVGGEGRRVSGSLVYGSRYTAVVIVSVLGYATAKFVDEHIDDCYENAKRVVGNDETLLSCSMAEENRDCMTDNAVDDAEIEGKIVEVFLCNGHCVEQEMTEKQVEIMGGEPALTAIAALDCTSQHGGEKKIEITENDVRYHGVYYKKERINTISIAIEKYRKRYLAAFCYSLVGSYETISIFTGVKGERFVRPCLDELNAEFDHNVRCKSVEKFDT